MQLPSRPPIRPKDEPRAEDLRTLLADFEAAHGILPGITHPVFRATLIAQLIDSERRVDFVRSLRNREISDSALTSNGRSFDPIRGAILMDRRGNHDEACWLVFLAAHFARNGRTEWQLVGDFYNRLGDGGQWTWEQVVYAPGRVAVWLDDNRDRLRASGGRFGNHRKYESLAGTGASGTGYAISTYVSWIGPTHQTFFDAFTDASATRESRFAALYESMQQVARFGRIGRFDYLSLLYKLGLADIAPDSCHLAGATGPRVGAKLLLLGSPNATAPTRQLETQLLALGNTLGVSPDVVEDAVCNWQKSPGAYEFFAG